MKIKLKGLGFGPNDIKLIAEQISDDWAEAERLAYLFHIEEPLHVPAFFGKPNQHTAGIKPDPVRGARLLAVWLAACRYVGSVVPHTNLDDNDSSSMQAHAGLVLLGQLCLGTGKHHSGLSQFAIDCPWFAQALEDAVFEYCPLTTLKPVLPGTPIDHFVSVEGPLRMEAHALIQAIPNSESMDQYRYGVTLEVHCRGKSILDFEARRQIFQNCYEKASNTFLDQHPLPHLHKRFMVSGSQRAWKSLAPNPKKIEETREKKKPIFPSLMLWRK